MPVAQAIKNFGARVLKLGKQRAPGEQKWVSMVDGFYKKRDKSALEQLHRQWFYNIAMRRGHQWIRPSSTTSELLPPPEDENRVRMTVNEMLGIHLMKLAKLTRENPVWTVSIDSDDEDAKDLAMNDEILLKYAFQSEDIEWQRLMLLGWAIDTGNAFWKVIWDHDAGGAIEDPFTGESVSEGDVRFIVVPPFDITLAYGTKTRMEDSPWILHSREETLDTIREDFPDMGEYVKAEKDTSQVSFYQKKLMSLVGNSRDYYGAEQNEEKDSSVLKEWFAKPCLKYPEGAYLAIANGVWLNPTEDGKPAPLPYAHLRKDPELPYPFIHVVDIPVSGSVWGMGTMENLIPVQKGKNRAWSQVLENGNNFGNIKLMAPKNSEIQADAFDDSGNEVIEYNDLNGKAPTYLQPVGLPNHVMGQFDLFDKAFMSISGQYEATKGDNPPGIKSGIAIARLQDADDTRNNPTMILYRSALRKAGKHVLNLYREFMVEDEERMVKIVGPNGVESRRISRDKLSSQFTLFVELQSQAAWSKEVRREQIQNAFNMGLLGDQNDPKVKKKVMEALEYGHLSQLFRENNLDEVNAKQNIERIETGDFDEIVPAEPVGVSNYAGEPVMRPPLLGIRAEPWEDHATHLDVYNNFRKSNKFRTQWTPWQKKVLNDLAEAHAKFLAPPPPPPVQPKVNISAKTEVPPDVLFKATGMEPPTPPPPDGIGDEPNAPPMPAPPTGEAAQAGPTP